MRRIMPPLAIRYQRALRELRRMRVFTVQRLEAALSIAEHEHFKARTDAAIAEINRRIRASNNATP